MANAASPDYFAHPERLAGTRRAREIARLQAYYRGTQYDGRPDFFTGGDPPVPLRERKPCIIYPLTKAACNQATRFTFGDGRFPTVKIEPTEQGAAYAPDLALTPEEAAEVTAYIARVIETAHLPSTMRTLLRHGLSQRTAVAAIGLRRGRFVVDMPRAMDCHPAFVDGDPHGDVERMAWCYAFDRDVEHQGRVTTEPHLFRRDFTPDGVTFYEPASVRVGEATEWRVDEAQSAAANHNLGFTPVVWIRNLPEAECSEIDGVALLDGLEDELDALNFALSQRHRGITYFGSPQAYETGVGEDEEPAERARVSRPIKGEAPGVPGAPRDPYGRGSRIATGPSARKTAPDQIWSYQSPQAHVGVFETTGKAFEVATKHVIDIRARILEAVDVVLLDPKEAAGRGNISGVALARLYAPLLALIDELRDCWWSYGLARILSVILRITARLGGKGILIPNAVRVAAICQRFFVKHEAGELWVPPTMTPLWGDYFSPSNVEIKDGVAAARDAKDAGLISPETATRFVGSYFGVNDAVAEVELAEGASPALAADRLARAREKALKALADPEGGDGEEEPENEDEAEPPETPEQPSSAP